ncbi:MAG: hypothetical protein AAFO69_15960, partial [Bacteroidota bacterium]
MNLKLILLSLLPLFACSNDPYDTSTPEKMVVSMGLISQQPASHNPLPYFYEKEAANAIGQFDKAGENVLTLFDQLREQLASKFPKHVKQNREGMLKITLDGFNGLKVRTFTYSATTIGGQLKERKPS